MERDFDAEREQRIKRINERFDEIERLWQMIYEACLKAEQEKSS